MPGGTRRSHDDACGAGTRGLRAPGHGFVAVAPAAPPRPRGDTNGARGSDNPRAHSAARRVAAGPAPARRPGAGRQLDCSARAHCDRAASAHGRSLRAAAHLTSTAGRECIMNQPDSNVVLAQRYTYATVALVIGLLSFVNLFGLEKSILAVILGFKTLSTAPAPALSARRGWAKAGISLGSAQLVLVVTIILLNLDRIPRIIEAFRTLSDGS